MKWVDLINSIVSALIIFIVFPSACCADSWELFYNGSYSGIKSMASYNGKLYVGNGFFDGEADILEYDGSKWSLSYDGGNKSVPCMQVYNGKLYAGLEGGDFGDGDVIVFDGTTWKTSFEGPQNRIASLAVHNNRLYAGTGQSDGYVYAYDGATWQRAYNATEEDSSVESMASYDGKLYAGFCAAQNGGYQVL